MASNTTPNKSNKPGKYSNKGRKLTDKDVKAAAGGNRTLVLILAGFTAVAIAIIAIIAVVSTGGGESADNFTPNDQGLIPVGDEAPNFTGDNLNGGGTVSLDGDQNATMLVFFASWCPHCQNEAPIISELESQYESDGLKTMMIGIDNSQGDNPEAVQGFVENFDIESPAIYQPNLGTEYNVTGYPTIYVLDGDNRVVGAHSGEMPRETLEGWIEDALG